jgi:hypothetical protein
MYSCYFDESGHPDDSKFVVVAGCIADVRQWAHLEREWKDVLLPLGILVFHSVDFEKRKAPYNQLSDAAATELSLRLVNIIRRRVERTISRAVPMAQFRTANDKYIVAEWFGHPYPMAARLCIAAVVDWAHHHSVRADEIKYYFEDGAKHKGQLSYVAERDRCPAPVFLPKAKAVPLQAADLIAWQHQRMLRNGISTPVYDALEAASNDWGVARTFEDPDQLAHILGIPERDPTLHYKSQVILHKGRRRVVIRWWPKSAGGTPPHIPKGKIELPNQEMLSPAELQRRLAIYTAEKEKRLPNT